MTDNDQQTGDVFAGAGRAARYVESEHTSTRAQVDEVLGQLAERDELIQVPPELATHAEPAAPVAELPPIPAAPPSAPRYA